MLHLIPAALHRVVLRRGHALRRVWWRWRKPVLAGVAVIARDDAGRVLLVRQSYGNGRWAFPAGGMARGEDPALAAAREFAEELGCGLADLALVAVLEEQLHGATDHVHLFSAQVAGDPVPDGREVLEAAFFAPDALPDALEKRVRPRLALIGL